jgi:thioredoxin 1
MTSLRFARGGAAVQYRGKKRCDEREKGPPMLLQEFNWKREVLQSEEPVLVDFWAAWCPPCRAMNPVIEALARDFKVCKVNVDTNQELAAHYDVASIPTLLLFAGGRIVARYTGVTPEATLRAAFQELRS